MLPLSSKSNAALNLETESLTACDTWPDFSSLEERQQAMAANSIGIPCLPLDWVMHDIEKNRRALAHGQLLIVSVVGHDQHSNGIERDKVQDFIYTARAAQDAGAHAIELNLSCPNVNADPHALYKDHHTLEALLTPILKALKNIPVTIKIGLCQGEHLRHIMNTIARIGLRGISGFNGLSRIVHTSEGHPAFHSSDRLTASITGTPLRPIALKFAQEASNFNTHDRLDLTILATGGVTHPTHFQDLLEAGAHGALVATGAIFDPWLAHSFHEYRHFKLTKKEIIYGNSPLLSSTPHDISLR
jgi:dihydroorotate dehydrogenase